MMLEQNNQNQSRRPAKGWTDKGIWNVGVSHAANQLYEAALDYMSKGDNNKPDVVSDVEGGHKKSTEIHTAPRGGSTRMQGLLLMVQERLHHNRFTGLHLGHATSADLVASWSRTKLCEASRNVIATKTNVVLVWFTEPRTATKTASHNISWSSPSSVVIYFAIRPQDAICEHTYLHEAFTHTSIQPIINWSPDLIHNHLAGHW